LKLYGGRVDMEQLMVNPTAPEMLRRDFKEIRLVLLRHRNRS
jgi:hypothetical protein